jgi:TonB family protein
MSVPERRQVERTVPERLVYIDIKPDNGGIVLNVSDGGLCFHSVAPIQDHQSIALSFFEQNLSSDAFGEVVWIDKSRKFGGLRFSRVTPEARGKIGELLQMLPRVDDETSRQLTLFAADGTDAGGEFSSPALHSQIETAPQPQHCSDSDTVKPSAKADIDHSISTPTNAVSAPVVSKRENEAVRPIRQLNSFSRSGKNTVVAPTSIPDLLGWARTFGFADLRSRVAVPGWIKTSNFKDRLNALVRPSEQKTRLIKAISSRAITIALLISAVAASISLSREYRSQTEAVSQSQASDPVSPVVGLNVAAKPTLQRVSLSPSTPAPISSMRSVQPSPIQSSPRAIVIKRPSANRDHSAVHDTVVSFKPPTLKPRPSVNVVPVRFQYPAVSDPSLSGKVTLKVLIGASGAVQAVNVVGGNRRLADASVRAIRQWRYRPVQVEGAPAEVEANVTIRFAGDDAVSVDFH